MFVVFEYLCVWFVDFVKVVDGDFDCFGNVDEIVGEEW